MQIVTIIPTLNRPNFLRKSLQSIHNQSIRPHKVIIINNNKNTDINKKVYEEFKKSLNLSYLNNFEPIETLRNSVAFDLDYDLISFLDDDDEWYPDKLEKQVKLFQDSDVVLIMKKLFHFLLHGLPGHRLRQGPCFLKEAYPVNRG